MKNEEANKGFILPDKEQEEKNMVRTKNKKIICYILVISALISGMCFENVEMDSLFACARLKKAASYIKSCNEGVCNGEVCTTEMLGVCNNTEPQQLTTRYTGQKGDIKVSLNLLCLEFLSLSEEKFFRSLGAIQFFYQNLDEIVTNYIHNSDGKKRWNGFAIT